jgi:putative ABC transport system ATP-binding protein
VDSLMIQIEQLRFSYRDSVFRLHIPELRIEDGQSVVLAGPSGSGKTTLLNLIAGILPADSGSIRIDNTCITQLPDPARRLFRLQQIGLVFQDFQLIDYLDVLDNVLLPCRIHPSVRLTAELRARAQELLDAVGIGQHSGRSIVRLSQGERQRAALCRALLLSPRLVLADEPTGNLDPGNSGRMVELMLAETKRAGATLMMVTHDHSLLSRFDRTIPFESFLEPRERVG